MHMHSPTSILKVEKQNTFYLRTVASCGDHVTQFLPMTEKTKSTEKISAFLIKGTDILAFFFLS